MTDNLQSVAADNYDETTTKLERAMGGLNVALGAVLIVDGVILAVMALCCLLLSFSLFFMAAVPAFFLIGFLCITAFGAAVANLIIGIGTILSSTRREKILRLFPIVTLIADVTVIPANIIALVCGSYLLYTEVNYLSVLIFIVAAVAILLATTSLTLSIIRIVKTTRHPRI